MHDLSRARSDLLTKIAKRPFLNIRREVPNAAMSYLSQRTFRLYELYALSAHKQLGTNRFAAVVSYPSYSF
jgi:hypothetical protein